MKRKNPDDVWAKVTEFKKNMDDVVTETLHLLEEYDVPPDWTNLNPCDEKGEMAWGWELNANRYWLRIYVPTGLATVDSDKQGWGHELSLRKAIRLLKKMMDKDKGGD